MTTLIANGPIKVTRGKEEVNGPRKPKELSNKPMGVKRGKEGVNWLRKPKE